jgi:DNA polymerase-1
MSPARARLPGSRWRWRQSYRHIPVGHRVTGSLDLDGPGEVSLEAAIERLRRLLEDPGVLKIGHDVKTAAHLLSRYGIALAPYDCTMLMSYVLDGGQFEHTIENLVRRCFEQADPPKGWWAPARA